MKCITCSSAARVLETRHTNEGHRVRRRYECVEGHRFFTIESHHAEFTSGSNKARQETFAMSVKRRSKRRTRDQEIRQRVAAGEDRGTLAIEYHMVRGSINRIARDSTKR